MTPPPYPPLLHVPPDRPRRVLGPLAYYLAGAVSALLVLAALGVVP